LAADPVKYNHQMSLLLNLLWIVFGGGFVLCLEYLLVGVVLCLSVVGIPFGIQCFKIAGLALLPFGRPLEPRATAAASGALHMVGNVLWFLLAGVWIFLSHLVLGLALVATIIGIPFALQHFKLAMLAVWPFGRELP
jgi:uncharacterized membrane protein YccF (DUF307 family)